MCKQLLAFRTIHGGLARAVCAAAAIVAAKPASRRERSLVGGPRPACAPPAAPCPVHRGGFEYSLYLAWGCRMRARLVVDREMEAVDEWDPHALDLLDPGAMDADEWRLERTAKGPGGDLSRARDYTLLAQAGAQTYAERWRAELLLFQIDRQLGRSPERVDQARVLAALRPGEGCTLTLLRQAAECTGIYATRRSVARWLHARAHSRPGWRR